VWRNRRAEQGKQFLCARIKAGEIMTQKLYKITLRGMRHSTAGVDRGTSHVLAIDSIEAYEMVRQDLIDRNIVSRELAMVATVELIADNCENPAC